MAGPIITLTTDFGLVDEYVGALKGVLLSYLYDARIIDLTHAIAPQDIHGAATILAHAAVFFPASTVHLAVVDPGVGSDRPILAVKTTRHIFVGPDNGILSPFLLAGPVVVHQITNTGLFRSPVSPTFQGRDIMAPVVARLAGGMDIDQVGPAVPVETCHLLVVPEPLLVDNQLVGRIVSRDHFGNLRSNISVNEIGKLPGKREIVLQVGGRTVTGLNTTYAEKNRGEIIALIDSGGFLEIAVVGGDAANTTKTGPGETIILSRQGHG
jgi:hypothetical protein